MKKQVIFRGAATALITPMRDGEIDYESLGKIIDMQIEGGIETLVVGGTTGEAATLTDAEKYSLFEFARERVGERARLIFGVGTNDTRAVLRHAREAERIGCDGLLAVTPYYNKGTSSGIVKHYLLIAEGTSVPVLLYNVPSRTGVNLGFAELDVLASHKNIVGIKEASDSLDRYVRLASYGEALPLYAGNDSQIYSLLSLGGCGVISVISNAYPTLVRDICESFFLGKYNESLTLQLRALPFIRALFSETNPTPIKYVMSRLGLSRDEVRLPLYTASEETRALLDRRISEFK